MRFGLRKPGAIPFLVLLVFSLLTLAPSLSSIYNLKLADFSYYGSGARQVHLLKDGASAHIRPDTYPTSDQRKSIIMTTPHQPRLSRLSRSSRAETDVPLPTSETPIRNRSQSSYAASESFMFARRARAFKTYVVQQLDDYQFLASYINRNLSTGTPNSPLTSPFNISVLSLPFDKCRQFYNFRSYKSHSVSDTNGSANSILQLPLTFRAIWQQVFQVAMEQWESFSKRFTYTAFVESNKHLYQAMMKERQTYSNSSSRQIGNLESSVSSNSSTTSRDGFEDAAAGRSAQSLRGSCMAVVIGLTVGVIWF